MDNLAWNDEGIRYELHNGKVVCMSPRPAVNHNIVSENIFFLFKSFLKGKKCMPFGDGTDVHLLPKKDRFVPDAMIVCNRDIIKTDGIYGVPDLVVEVLSPSTAKNDRGYKKDLYEQYGVKEYWIVDPRNCSIEVYLLKDSKFVLEQVYAIYPDYAQEQMKDEGQEIVTEFQVSFLEDLKINLHDVFSDML